MTRYVPNWVALIGIGLALMGLRAMAAPPAPANVNLNYIAGLGGNQYGFGTIWYDTTFNSLAAATNGKMAYFGLCGSDDPAMRNLVVTTLNSTGAVTGVPQCYVTSTYPLAPTMGYPQTGSYQADITAMLLNPGKK